MNTTMGTIIKILKVVIGVAVALVVVIFVISLIQAHDSSLSTSTTAQATTTQGPPVALTPIQQLQKQAALNDMSDANKTQATLTPIQSDAKTETFNSLYINNHQ